MQQESAADGEAAEVEVPAPSPLDEAIADLEAPAPAPQAQSQALLQRPPSRGPQLRLIDVSLDVLLYAGFSSENDESISTLQGGGHDPKTRGYTLGQAEFVAVRRGRSLLHRRGAHPVPGQLRQRRNPLSKWRKRS